MENQAIKLYNSIMILFHGSDKTVEKPNLDLSRKNLDFGSGFYSTANREQAVNFAKKVKVRKRQNSCLVSVYNFDIEAAESVLKILKFDASDRLWLDFVHQNRQGTYSGKPYDLIIGPVANDDVFATLIIYEQGILNIEQTLESLKIKKLFNQFVFKTEKAISFLGFVDSFDPELI